jgi:hypothetical protein
MSRSDAVAHMFNSPLLALLAISSCIANFTRERTVSPAFGESQTTWTECGMVRPAAHWSMRQGAAEK